MSYYKILGFKEEPFSTSPDPDFLYMSRAHDMVITNILIELRLKRGLQVVYGNIGTGKTTLSRKLIQELQRRSDISFQIVLNPTFTQEEQLLKSLINNFSIPFKKNLDLADRLEMRDSIEKFLISENIRHDRTVVLIIDEAQKLTPQLLETLRLLLNFETNSFKLFQIILFGQLELCEQIKQMPNFLDRVAFKYHLNSLDQNETKAMIEFRIQKAGYSGKYALFFDEALSEIYEQTSGYPRKINLLCHQILMELILQNQNTADQIFVQEVVNKYNAISPMLDDQYRNHRIQGKESYWRDYSIIT